MVIRSCYIVVLFLILLSTCQEKNATDKIDIRDENHKIEKYVAVLLFTIFLLYGIIGNILMATVFCCKRGNHYSHSFIIIASQLIINNFLAFIPHVVVVMHELLQIKKSLYGRFHLNLSYAIDFGFTQLNITLTVLILRR